MIATETLQAGVCVREMLTESGRGWDRAREFERGRTQLRKRKRAKAREKERDRERK